MWLFFIDSANVVKLDIRKVKMKNSFLASDY